MTFLLRLIAVVLAYAAFAAPGQPLRADAIVRHNFGEVPQGQVVEHTFALANDSDKPARITGVHVTPPLSLARMPAVVPAAGKAQLRVRVDTSKVQGDYEGRMIIALEGGVERVFSLDGRVIPPIQVLPLPAFFISTVKGTAKTDSLEIVNREEAPLTLQLPDKPPYETKLETLEAGRRFRLSVTVPASAAAGRTATRLELKTSSARRPVLPIGFNVIVRERVHAFPDRVDFGSLRMAELSSPGHAAAAQTLMVYQVGGKRFAVEAASDVPGLNLKVEPGPQGDRAQLTLSLDPARTKPGPVKGTLVVKTNDPEFPELRVPLSGTIAP